MKTSLATTFFDLSQDQNSVDRIYPHRVTVRNIIDENDAPLSKGSVLVLRPYAEAFGSGEKFCTLLVNPTLRAEFEALHRDADRSKDALLKALKKQSGSKRDLAKEISVILTRVEGEFDEALVRVREEVHAQKDAPFADVPYDRVFDEKVVEFLKTGDFSTAIREYIERYEQVIAKSNFFRKGFFNYYNASTIAKSLTDNGFFKAKHTVWLHSQKEQKEIKNEKELEALIQAEKDTIANDPGLKAKFAEIALKLDKNAQLRDFYNYLVANLHILP
jgi:hypothetical protein